MVNVKGKWALVTGSSRGVGRQIALFMAKEGCNLILHSRSLAHTGKLLEEVTAMGVEAYAVEAELSDPAAVNRMLDEMEEKGTPVDIDLMMREYKLHIVTITGRHRLKILPRVL